MFGVDDNPFIDPVQIRVHPELRKELLNIQRMVERKMRRKGINRGVFQNEVSFIASQMLKKRRSEVKIKFLVERKGRGRMTFL